MDHSHEHTHDHAHDHAAPPPASNAGESSGVLVTLTEKAIQKVLNFAANNQEAKGKNLRVYVQGGGCSGFQYGFMFDEIRDDDETIEVQGVKVALDPISLPYLKGATLDWVEDFRGSGFVVQNPNATGSCGCGHSFSV